MNGKAPSAASLTAFRAQSAGPFHNLGALDVRCHICLICLGAAHLTFDEYAM
jgi:hypothetical protein